MVGVGQPLLPEILGQPVTERNRRFWTDTHS